jgi:hypothetical protein
VSPQGENQYNTLIEQLGQFSSQKIGVSVNDNGGIFQGPTIQQSKRELGSWGGWDGGRYK